jgi:uracil-DNA glycosylase family 4
MENLFKQNLLRLRKPLVAKTFSEALLGSVWWGSKKPRSEDMPPVIVENLSEKTLVLESLERFAQEKVKEIELPVIKFPRGEIHVKAEHEWSNIQSYQSVGELTQELSVPLDAKNIIFNGKTSGQVKVIFVSESFRSWEEAKLELKEGFLNELILGFPLKTAEYFKRMIEAMKLTPNEVIIYPVEEGDKDLSEDVIKITAFFRPEIVITLGAKATNKILKSNDRLSNIHGQFLSRKINDSTHFTVVALFHPTIIETNMNMKKTAWADMQKIMKHLKKL